MSRLALYVMIALTFPSFSNSEELLLESSSRVTCVQVSELDDDNPLFASFSQWYSNMTSPSAWLTFTKMNSVFPVDCGVIALFDTIPKGGVFGQRIVFVFASDPWRLIGSITPENGVVDTAD
ncbi:MAG: hypothetical protein K8F25_10475 [Fimbriimonadaceae bacterium]|nr:hypothetical protein [Alphaproteobacteria bacterium]